MFGYEPVKLAYDKVEPDGGPNNSLSPIIFHHGLNGCKENWKNLINEVSNATQRTAYAVDARNHGDSEWSDEFSLEIVAEDLLNFMDTLDIPKAILVGHSIGGFASIIIALKKPERVERLIVGDIGVKPPSEELMELLINSCSLYLTAAEATTSEMSEEEAKMSIAKSIFIEMNEEIKERCGIMAIPEVVKEVIYIRQKPEGGWMFKANLAAIQKVTKAGEITTEELEGTYEGPATFIYGTLSEMNVRAEEEEIRKFFPNAEFIPIEATHLMHSVKPKEFTEELLKILS